MLKGIVLFYQKGVELLKQDYTLLQIKSLDVYKEIYKMKYSYSNKEIKKYDELIDNISRAVAGGFYGI